MPPVPLMSELTYSGSKYEEPNHSSRSSGSLFSTPIWQIVVQKHNCIFIWSTVPELVIRVIQVRIDSVFKQITIFSKEFFKNLSIGSISWNTPRLNSTGNSDPLKLPSPTLQPHLSMSCCAAGTPVVLRMSCASSSLDRWIIPVKPKNELLQTHKFSSIIRKSARSLPNFPLQGSPIQLLDCPKHRYMSKLIHLHQTPHRTSVKTKALRFNYFYTIYAGVIFGPLSAGRSFILKPTSLALYSVFPRSSK